MKNLPQTLSILLLFLVGYLNAQSDSCNIQAAILVTDPICFGIADGIIDIPNVRNAETPFLIEFDGRTSTSLVRFVGVAAGEYTVTITDAVGCVYTETIELISSAPFIIDAGPDRMVDLGEFVSITPTANQPISQVQWQPINGDTTNSNALGRTFTPTVSDYYSLTASSEDGCLATDSIFIDVNPVQKVYVPNVFSPNGDGINDFFAIYSDVPNVQSVSDVAIFDRWGNLLFQQPDLNNSDSNNLWDGTYRGQVVARGTYIYTVKVLFLDGREEVIRGDVSVIY